MFTCKQVSNALADHDYEKLSPVQKALLKFHVAMCVVCGKYNKQVMTMQDGARKFREREDELLSEASAPTLPADCKEAIKKSLQETSQS